MILILSIVAFIFFCFVEADGKDWVQGQRNADRRARDIINAIHSSATSITNCNKNIWEAQKQMLIEQNNKQYEGVDEITHFQDAHGRWFRERLVYDSEGRIIAKETIGVEQ